MAKREGNRRQGRRKMKVGRGIIVGAVLQGGRERK